jgi:raffinose/stachyose/melibiose transport system permease protein
MAVTATWPEATPRYSRGHRWFAPSHRWSKILVFIVLVLQIYPLFWIITASLKTGASFADSNAFSLPVHMTFQNYARAFNEADLPRFLINSLVVTTASDVLIVALGMMAAYAIQVLGFPFSKLVLAMFLGGIVVPVQVVLVPLFIDYTHVGLLNSYESLVLPYVGFAMPISVYLFVSFFSYIPTEVYEAASLDGCGPYRLFLRVTLPLSLATIVTVVFINSIFIWNDFIFANTFLLSDSIRTVPLGLESYLGEMGSTDWTATFAAVSVTSTPLLLAFLALNKALVRGLEGRPTKVSG